MDHDDEVIIERNEDGSVKSTLIHDVESFKKRWHESYQALPVPQRPTEFNENHPIPLPPEESREPDANKSAVYAETYEMKRQKVISQCPYRSYKKYSTVDGQVVVEHLYRDGTVAEGGGCCTMKCLLGKGNNGNVTIEDCTACVTEAGLLGKELPPQPPSVFQKIKNFGKAAINHIMEGVPTASPEQQEERLKICGGCQYNKGGTCQVCGCNLKLKTSWAEQQCPLPVPKWGPVVPQDKPAEPSKGDEPTDDAKPAEGTTEP